MRTSDWKIAKKGIVLAVMPWLFSLIFLGMLIYLLAQAEQEISREARAKEVHAITINISRCFFEAVSTISTYMFTRSRAFGVRFDQLRAEESQLSDRLRELIHGNKASEDALKELSRVEEKSFELLATLREAADEGDTGTFLRIDGLRSELEASLKEFVHRLSEFSRLQESTSSRANSSKFWSGAIKGFVGVGFLVSALVCLFSSNLFSKHITRRLEIIVENTRRLARQESLPEALNGSDEIAVLDSTFHEMARALEESATRERAVIDNAVDVICSLNSELIFLAVSPAAEKVWNRVPETLVGNSISILLLSQHLDNFLKELIRIKDSQRSGSFENVMPLADGVRTMLWSAHWSASQSAYFCVVHDITERKEAEEMLRQNEERLRRMLEHIPVGLLILNRNGIIEAANYWFKKVLGFDESELHGKSVRILVDEALNSPADLNTMMERTSRHPFDCQARNHVGALVPAELSLISFPIGIAGEEKFLLAIADVTARREIEQLKGEYVAMLSHDLRSPLAAIQITVESLHEEAFAKLTSEGSALLTKTEKEVDRLLQMLNDLLDLERVRDGKLPLNKEAAVVQTIVAQAIESMNPLAERKSVCLSADLDDCEVFADGERLIRVIINLLSNAIKYSPAGGTVRIWCREVDEYAEVRVSDEGPGLPDGYEDVMFKRFEQLTHDNISKGGSGLGLSICKAIVESHGGQIGVQPGVKGTTFWFRIPL